MLVGGIGCFFLTEIDFYSYKDVGVVVFVECRATFRAVAG